MFLKLLDLHLKKKYIKQLFYFIVHLAFLQIIFLDFAAHILYQTGHLMFFGSQISFQGWQFTIKRLKHKQFSEIPKEEFSNYLTQWQRSKAII